MTAKTIPQQNDEIFTTGLTPPVRIDEFHDDVANIFLHYVRNIAWMVDAETAWAITKAPALENPIALLYTDVKAADLDLGFQQIKETEFARAMQRMYDFAYSGLVDLSAEPFEDGSIHTWISALLVDAAEGAMSTEWNMTGLYTDVCGRRCVQIAETANARAILEGGEPFFSYFRGYNKDDSPEEGLLTVRQVALLAGMEEMSIRAAANPNRALQLRPTKTDSGTRFEISVVREWLQQKKRYVPIKKGWSAGELNLAKKRFASLDEVASGLDARYHMIGLSQGFEQLDQQLRAIGFTANDVSGRPFIRMPDEFFNREESVRAIAGILNLPEALLVLRVKEVMATESLRAIEKSIQEFAD